MWIRDLRSDKSLKNVHRLFHKTDELQNHLGSVRRRNKTPNHWNVAGADVIFQQMFLFFLKN